MVAVASCALLGSQAKPAPTWLIGHYQGHSVRAPSYPFDMTVDAAGHVTIVNPTNTVSGQYTKDDAVVWSNGKGRSSVRATDDGVVLTQVDDASDVEVFTRKQ